MMIAGAQENEIPAVADRRDFEVAGREITALRVTRANRPPEMRAAWRFGLVLPGDRDETTVHVSGYIAPAPEITLKEVVASLLAAPPLPPPARR